MARVRRYRLGGIAVRRRDDLEQVPVGIVEVDAAAAEVMVDAAGLLLRRIGPDLARALADARERAVELFLADEEREVLQRDRLGLGRQVVDRDVVREVDDEEAHEAPRRRQAEDLRQESRGLFLIVAPDDRVIEPGCHGVAAQSRAWSRGKWKLMRPP